MWYDEELKFINEAEEAGERFAETAAGLLEALHTAQNSEDNCAEDDARQRIEEFPLEMQVRSDRRDPSGAGLDEDNPTEYHILLSTGGPASRIIGDLSEHCEPTSARFEYQDWFKPWTEAHRLTDEQNATILKFAQQFYFGG